MSDYLRLDSAPGLDHPGNPICQACDIETTLEDGWLCPSCGTSWSSDLLEGDPSDGTLYADWSGEELTGPICPVGEAWQVSHLRGADRDRRVQSLIDRLEGGHYV